MAAGLKVAFASQSNSGIGVMIGLPSNLVSLSALLVDFVIKTSFLGRSSWRTLSRSTQARALVVSAAP